MANSGKKTIAVTDYDWLTFEWEVASQNIAQNVSYVKWTLILESEAYGKISSTATKAYYVTVDGVYFTGENTVGIGNNATKTLASGMVAVPHNSDGTKTLNYLFLQEFAITFSGEWVGDVEGDGSGVLPAIPRASTLTVANGTLGTAQTLSIARQSTAFTHTITYKCGTASGTIATKSSSTSISWTPPLTLASQNTAGTSVSIALTISTYTGSTLVGSSTKNITCAMPASVKPSCSLTLEDISGVDDIYGSPVQGLSRIKIKVNTTPSYGSAIAAYEITANGAKYTTAEATTGVLLTAGDSPVTATVKDKRGRSGSASYTMKVQAYTPPTISSLTVRRCDEDGTANDQGEFVEITFSAAVSSMSGKNTAAYTLRHKKSNAAEYTEMALTELANTYAVEGWAYILPADSGSSYDIEITVADRHGTMSRATSASTAAVLMHWHKSGTGLAIGKVAEEENTFDVGMDAHFRGSFRREGNKYCFSTPGVAGTAGFIRMARIEIIEANADTPITFVFSQRRMPTPMTVHLALLNSTTTASSLSSICYEGSNYGAFAVQTSEMVWDLYVQKVSTYDTITLQDWWSSKTMESRVKITFPGDLVDEVPAPYYRATPAELRSLLDYIYPVGSVYISYSHVSPGELFGGTWVRIENAFLWGVDASGIIGQTGGESEVTLSVLHLPAHQHGITAANTESGGYGASNTIRFNNASTSYLGTIQTQSSGNGRAHNNMPPYIQVSIWRRTA